MDPSERVTKIHSNQEQPLGVPKKPLTKIEKKTESSARSSLESAQGTSSGEEYFSSLEGEESSLEESSIHSSDSQGFPERMSYGKIFKKVLNPSFVSKSDSQLVSDSEEESESLDRLSDSEEKLNFIIKEVPPRFNRKQQAERKKAELDSLIEEFVEIPSDEVVDKPKQAKGDALFGLKENSSDNAEDKQSIGGSRQEFKALEKEFLETSVFLEDSSMANSIGGPQYTSKNIRKVIANAISVLKSKLEMLNEKIHRLGGVSDLLIDPYIEGLDFQRGKIDDLLTKLNQFNHTRPLFKKVEKYQKKLEVLLEKLKEEQSKQQRDSNQIAKLKEKIDLEEDKYIQEIGQYIEIVETLEEAFQWAIRD